MRSAAAWREYLDNAGFVAGSTFFVGGLDAIQRCGCVAKLDGGLMQGRLVRFDLCDQMNATGSGMLECFF